MYGCLRLFFLLTLWVRSSVLCGLSLCSVGFRPCSEGFSPGTLVFLPQQKPTRSLFELAVGCAHRSCTDRTAAASGAYMYAFGPTLSSCVLAVLAWAISPINNNNNNNNNNNIIIIIIIIITNVSIQILLGSACCSFPTNDNFSLALNFGGLARGRFSRCVEEDGQLPLFACVNLEC